MILTPNTMMPMAALNFLSPDGKRFTLGARANGYCRGEGIGVVVLKRLQDALRDDPLAQLTHQGPGFNYNKEHIGSEGQRHHSTPLKYDINRNC
jgi:hypothetical protein